MSRVPIHIATIENFTLVPLQNGKNISDQIAENIGSKEKNHDLINTISNIIKYGSYEEFLKHYMDPVKVVSIVGRQSSGKSYVMNRFFGTRFNVASTRCTDGIWISLSEIWITKSESMLIIVLDCEGLFSARRNDQEEMKLAFNRYLNQLFTNFSKGIGRIKGKKLFKGNLMMLIRDVKSQDSEGAYKEMMANMTPITSKQNNFLSSLFQGTLISQCLNYFEQPIFNTEIDNIRKQYFLSLKVKRWANGRDFLDSSKITLSQIFVDDDTDMDLHKMNISCEHLFKECLKYFYEGEGIFKTNLLVFESECHFKEKQYSIQIKHEDVKFELIELLDEKIETDKYYPAKELVEIFSCQTEEYSRNTHNEWLINFSKFLDSFLQERVNIIVKYFQDQFKEEKEFISVLNVNLSKLNSVLSMFCNSIKFCSKICRKCERICESFLNHGGDCDCKTGHRCEGICDRTEECIQNKYICLEVYGHEGAHRCNEGRHMCDHFCDIGDEHVKCANLCGYEAGHKEPANHNCKNSHPCSQKCQDSKWGGGTSII